MFRIVSELSVAVSDTAWIAETGSLISATICWQPALFMNADVGPELWRVLLQKLAKGDPLPIFLKSFYNNEVGKEAPEARAGSLAPLDNQEVHSC